MAQMHQLLLSPLQGIKCFCAWVHEPICSLLQTSRLAVCSQIPASDRLSEQMLCISYTASSSAAMQCILTCLQCKPASVLQL